MSTRQLKSWWCAPVLAHLFLIVFTGNVHAVEIDMNQMIFWRWKDVPGSETYCGVFYGDLLAQNDCWQSESRPGHVEISLKFNSKRVDKYEVIGDIPLGPGGWGIAFGWSRTQHLEWGSEATAASVHPGQKGIIFACVQYNVKKKVQRAKRYGLQWRELKKPIITEVGVEEREGVLKEVCPSPYMSARIVSTEVDLQSILSTLPKDDDLCLEQPPVSDGR